MLSVDFDGTVSAFKLVLPSPALEHLRVQARVVVISPVALMETPPSQGLVCMATFGNAEWVILAMYPVVGALAPSPRRIA